MYINCIRTVDVRNCPRVRLHTCALDRLISDFVRTLQPHRKSPPREGNSPILFLVEKSAAETLRISDKRFKSEL